MEHTALILGAGSSKTFGLPLGSELRNTIARDLNIKFKNWGTDLLSGSYEIVEALQLLNRSPEGRPGDINPHRLAAVEIAEAMPLSSSIDEYIERHSDDSKKAVCAKLAIVKSILDAERRSSIYIDQNTARSQPLQKATESWLSYFLRDLTRSYRPENVQHSFDNLTIVNFNYDRCVEQFLYIWLQEVYRLDQAAAAAIVQDLSIYHPYGRVAPLDWEDHSNGFGFGAGYSPNSLLRMSEGIRTYSEVFEPDSGLFEIRKKLGAASTVVFLGFGFHKQNMDILEVGETRERLLRCYATRSGISNPRWDVMKGRICKSFGVPSSLLSDYSMDQHCEVLWAEYCDVILSS